jgi:hypothetical protein
MPVINKSTLMLIHHGQGYLMLLEEQNGMFVRSIEAIFSSESHALTITLLQGCVEEYVWHEAC